jgi:GalNAc5-diNAcBac-PP-undecaprenol beta-1,3-glucosyltransferase
MEPKVAVIVTTFDRKDLVTRAIDSVLAQDYGNLSLLVIDDGSTDGTKAVLERYRPDPRVKLIFHETNKGVTGAKNSGLDNLSADTRYFAFLDSDDQLLPDAITNLVRGFCHGDISQVYGVCIDWETSERVGQFTGCGSLVTYEDALCGNLSGDFLQLVRVDLLKGARFDERAGGGEAGLWHVLLKTAPGLLSNSAVSRVDRSPADRVSLDRYDTATSQRKRWVYLSYLERVGDDLRRLNPQRHCALSLEAAKWTLLAGKRAEAVCLLAKCGLRSLPMRWVKIAILCALPTKLLRLLHEVRHRPRVSPAHKSRRT